MEKLLAIILLSVLIIIQVQGKFEFTNVNCDSMNKSMVQFESCYLRAVNRTYKYFSMRLKWCKEAPAYNVSATFVLLKKANGYKPFLYNVTFDACKYLKTRSNPVVRYFHSWFEAYSNMNHTCPYGTEDIMIEKLPVTHLDNMMTAILPLPAGDYLFHSSWYTYNVKHAVVKVKGKVF